MANNQKFTLTFDAQLKVDQMKASLTQFQNVLNGLHLPQNVTRGVQGTFDSLSKEIRNFEVALSKDITGKSDFKKLDSQANKVAEAFEKLKIQVRDLTNLKGDELEKLLPSKTTKNINDATKAISNYENQIKDAEREIKTAQKEVDGLNKKIEDTKNKTPVTKTQWKELNTSIDEVSTQISEYEEALKSAQEKQNNIAEGLKEPAKSKRWREARDEVEEYKNKLEEAKTKQQELVAEKSTKIISSKQAEDLLKFNNQLTIATQNLNSVEQILVQLKSATEQGGFQELITQISELTGIDLSNFTGNMEELKQVVGNYTLQELEKLKSKFDNLKNSVDGTNPVMEEFRQKMRENREEVGHFDDRLGEVEQLKRRITYFFGLNNTIQLVKRTMKSAISTIKELDAAMTETAVVTDFSVADMWEQLPEYTKRANELGVSTKAAYEAATLYYQQGLKTNEVMAISNETLKMARIAGLDAAVSTDRMTNALRGFNMVINEVNAQRINDVYSRLAAISASNVDEISTAMTKVASLASSANMEFESTAAFLAQIINIPVTCNSNVA